MAPDRLHAAREIGAEDADELGYREIDERALAAGFELGRAGAAEIGFDHRAAERPDLIGAGRGPSGIAESAALLRKLLGVGERQEQLVGEPERQARGGIGLLGERGQEQVGLHRDDVRRERHDDGPRFDHAACVSTRTSLPRRSIRSA